MAITKTTLYSGSWNTLRDLISNTLVDPEQRHKEMIVHAIRQRPNNDGFCGYPYIIMSPIKVKKEAVRNDGDTTELSFVVKFEVLATDYPKLDKMTDALANVFNTQANLNTLRNNGLEGGLLVEDEDTGEDYVDGQKVFVRTAAIPFKATMKVMS